MSAAPPSRFFNLLRSPSLRKMGHEDRVSRLCRLYCGLAGTQREILMVPGFQVPTPKVKGFHWMKGGKKLYRGGRQKRRPVIEVGKGWLLELLLSIGLNVPVGHDNIKVTQKKPA